MTRDAYETVTGFTLLIPASASKAMGDATFFPESGGSKCVRAITLEEIRATARKLRGAEADHFDALLSLRGALESVDQLALVQALERREKLYRRWEAESPMMQSIIREMKLSPEKRRFSAVIQPAPAAENPQKLFSYEVSQAVGSLLEGARIVLWWFKGEFRPAIYCADTKIALFVHTFFLAPVGGVGFRICPYDGEQFFQDLPNQEYCCPAHREAHRVARWRENKKRMAGKQRKATKNREPKERF